MVFDVVIGRSKKDLEKYGKEGTILMGKQYIKMGQTTSLSNPVYLDVAGSHVVFIVGKRGSGKSYSLGAIAEGIADLPQEIKQNLSIILLDTMGIYWTMKYPNFQDAELLKQWGIEAKPLDVKIYTPTGFYYQYKEQGIPTDFPFSIRPLDVNPEDWCTVFSIDQNSAEGVLITRIVQELGRKKTSYSLDTLLDAVHQDTESDPIVNHIVLNEFKKAKGWEIFSAEGTPLKDIVARGQVTVLDVSPYATMGSGWDIKALVVGLIARTLFNQRMLTRKTEEFKTVDAAMHYFSKEVEEKLDEPLVWLGIDECLPYSSSITTSRGKIKIGQIINQWMPTTQLKVLGYDLSQKKVGFFPITKVYKKGVKNIIELTTETGRKIKCTPEHKILTADGFKEAQIAEEIGTPLQLNYSQERKHIVARLVGHLYGDGWLSANQKQAGFSGKRYPEDLEIIRGDLHTIGLSSSKIYSRKTVSTIKAVSGKEAIVEGTSHSVGAGTKVFNFFSELSIPIGSKTNTKVLIPKWLMGASKLEKAEFLAALFGADGVAPSQSKKWGGDFNAIRLTFNKASTLRSNGEQYARQIKFLLEDIGVKVSNASERKNGGNLRKDGTASIKFQITLAKNVENTIKFLETVGYRYCTEKEIKGNKWLLYLKARQHTLKEREQLRLKALKIRKETGWGKIKIARKLGIQAWQVRDWIYHGRGTKLCWSFSDFDVWNESRVKNNILYENILSKIKKKAEPVFDISVDKVHNFVADGFIVHNCHELLPKEGKTAATNALITILREGRQPGISLILASQQPGKIHTDVLTQADTVIAHRLTARMDVDALGMLTQSYMRHGLEQEIDFLPRVQGAAVIFDDANERIFPVQMRPRFTWHGGGSPFAIPEKKEFFKKGLEKLKEL
ncbi:DUF87 domain-containing protein [Candidatus Woesearchaeota archaeon]|nr:DUF87 domain-containing protein [Candidatus Woesearchaeota archaeon]